MPAYILGEIQLDAPFMIQNLLQLQFELSTNRHATGYFKVVIAKEVAMELLEKNMHGLAMQLYMQEEIIFCGFFRKTNVAVKNGEYQVIAHLSSATTNLDQQIKYRSFQDIHMTYQQVIDSILSDYKNAKYLFSATDREIGTPLIQYGETDWAFIQRLASHFHLPLVADVKSDRPRFWFGIPAGTQEAEYPQDSYAVTLESRYCKTNSLSGFEKRPLFRYVVAHTLAYAIGDYLTIAGNRLIICDKRGELVGGELVFHYILGQTDLFEHHRIEPSLLTGRSIHGTVLETKKDTVKVHFVIDENQDISQAFWFRWAPMTGNIFYLMPEVGTDIAVYFGSTIAADGIGVTCFRPSTQAEEFEYADLRGLRTDDGKRILLHPNKTGYISDSSATSIILDDHNGMTWSSPSRIQMHASGAIHLSSKKISLYTPSNLGLYQVGPNQSFDKDIKPLASIDFSGPTVNMYSKNGKADLRFQKQQKELEDFSQSNSRNFMLEQQENNVMGGMTMAQDVSDDSAFGEKAITSVMGGLARTSDSMRHMFSSGTTSMQGASGSASPSLLGLKIGCSPLYSAALLSNSVTSVGEARQTTTQASGYISLEKIQAHKEDIPVISTKKSNLPVTVSSNPLVKSILAQKIGGEPIEVQLIQEESITSSMLKMAMEERYGNKNQFILGRDKTHHSEWNPRTKKTDHVVY